MTYTEWQRRDHTREVQEYLRILATVDNNYNELAVDGIYGSETTEAVKQFQLMNGLEITGTVDRDTWDQLTDAHLDALTLFATAAPIRPFIAPQFVLKPGDSSNEVSILQAVINGILDDTIAISGVYDADTVARVAELQRISGFEPTGEVDRYFWDHLAQLYNGRRG